MSNQSEGRNTRRPKSLQANNDDDIFGQFLDFRSLNLAQDARKENAKRSKHCDAQCWIYDATVKDYHRD